MSTLTPHDADTQFLTRQAMYTGYQYFSILTPVIYTVLVRRGRTPFSINNALRATWMGGLAGSASAGGLAYARYAYTSEATVRQKRIHNAYNTSRLRADDHATIGAVLGSVLTPAILWKRAGVIHLVLGGAALGSGVGLLAHHCRTLMGDAPPKAQIPPGL
ncbi:hypothetical protein AMATHDRAFT_63747 [Amanita thiersii Skay4041]|uniref:Uncharacterized protein n=1 Tax=Amanita thiersii Skay4041 TaxID=703135 RepID=A0A2A9NMZ5_9AGAR|nr:hypothetical protein AMATHDRAFT_63747 [Amanita thiersii Skay4041]